MKLRFFPSLRVHIWGGAGSQLFGVLAADRLKVRFPYRRVRLVFHSSGVTKRNREIPERFLEGYEIQEIDDFVGRSGNALHYHPRLEKDFSRMKNFSKLIFFKTRLILSLNKEEDYPYLKPWIISTRGHYSYIKIRAEEIQRVASITNSRMLFDTQVTKQQVALHFRLGDLLYLEEKTHISRDRLLGVLEKLPTKDPVLVYSDSSFLEIKSILKSFLSDRVRIIENPNVFQTISDSVSSSSFVGTNSKISIWIAFLRVVANVGVFTALPLELKVQMQRMMSWNQIENIRIVYY